jgi:hypothetical protein
MQIDKRKLAPIVGTVVVVLALVLGIRIFSQGDSGGVRSNAEEGVEQGDLFNAPNAVDVPLVTVPLGTNGVGVRPTLFAEANPSDANAGVISDSHKVDDSGRLEIASAKFVDGNGPKDLIWSITAGDAEIECRNCAYLPTRLRTLIAEVLDTPVGGKVKSIVGWEPSRATPGDFSGFGEQVEFVFANDRDGSFAAQALSNWLLNCDETCRANDLSFSDVVWNNMLWSSRGCGQDMATVVPNTLYAGFESGKSAEADRDAGIDRVIVASPSHRPYFEEREGLQVMTAWQVTGCGTQIAEGN